MITRNWRANLFSFTAVLLMSFSLFVSCATGKGTVSIGPSTPSLTPSTPLDTQLRTLDLNLGVLEREFADKSTNQPEQYRTWKPDLQTRVNTFGRTDLANARTAVNESGTPVQKTRFNGIETRYNTLKRDLDNFTWTGTEPLDPQLQKLDLDLATLEKRFVDGQTSYYTSPNKDLTWQPGLQRDVDAFGERLTNMRPAVDESGTPDQKSQFNGIETRYNTLARDLQAFPPRDPRDPVDTQLQKLDLDLAALEKRFVDGKTSYYTSPNKDLTWKPDLQTGVNTFGRTDLANARTAVNESGTPDQKSQFNGIETRYNTLARELPPFPPLDDSYAWVTELENKLQGLNDRLTNLSTYPVPDEFVKKVIDFNQLVSDADQFSKDKDEAIRTHYSPNYPTEIQNRLDRLDANYGTLRTGLDREKSQIFSDSENGIKILDGNVSNLIKDLDRLDDFELPEDINPILENFQKLENSVEALEPDFVLGRNVKANFKPLDQESRGAQIVTDFDAVDGRYKTLKNDVANAKTALFDKLNGLLTSELEDKITELHSVLVESQNPSLEPEEVFALLTTTDETIADVDYAFVVGRDVRDNQLGSLAQDTRGKELIARFNALNDRFSNIKRDTEAARVTTLKKLQDQFSDLDKQLSAVEKSYADLRLLIEDLPSGTYLYPNPSEVDVNRLIRLVSTLSSLDAPIAALNAPFEAGKTIADGLNTPPQSNDAKVLTEKFAGMETRLKSLTDDAAATKSAIFVKLTAELNELDRAVAGQEAAYNALYYYTLFDQFSDLVSDFSKIKTDVNNLQGSFTAGQRISRNLGTLAQEPAGKFWVQRFNDLDSEYTGLKNAVIDSERIAFEYAKNELDALENEVAALKAVDTFNSPNDLNEFPQQLRALFALKATSEALKEYFDIGDIIASGLGEFASVSPGKDLINRYSAIRASYSTLSNKINDAVRERLNMIEHALELLDTDVRGFGVNLMIQTRLQFTTPDQTLQVIDVPRQKEQVNAFEWQFAVGSAIRNNLTSIAGTQEIIAKFDALQTIFDGLKAIVAGLDNM
ncbi:hypothetical protein FACS1894172_04800 [Spirochaetia bacterium]|nr:hypothetical protein FACS1894172_04800 [Spirochaetia bacterium]